LGCTSCWCGNRNSIKHLQSFAPFLCKIQASVALIGWIPILCIVIYSKLSLWFSLGYVGVNIALTVWWCRRFVVFFRRVYADQNLWANLYVEEPDAVYYMQTYDKWLFEKKFKFPLNPSISSFIAPIVFAILLIPFTATVSVWVGLSFMYIFLALTAIPLSLLSLGWATKGYLVYYYYPWKIKRQTGKNVYVDMASPSPNCK
jgi:hypothetical protein